jgi:hypothetical protein
MNLEERIAAFADLGQFFKQYLIEQAKDEPQLNEGHKNLEIAIQKSTAANAWFTNENIIYALNNWANALIIKQLEEWLKPYTLIDVRSKKVAIIMAGNIPLVGFHDFISVLLCGHSVLVKQSSNDQYILPVIVDILALSNAEFQKKISITSEKLSDFDAVIATGSNNTARYFEYYFRGKPSIIRKNRNSVAILTGDETPEELELLSEDIFRYFGLGCRNVSKIFIPENYNFDPLFNALFKWSNIINHHKYANNYDYNKAVYLMSEFAILDNGFFMFKEDLNYASPISVAFYEYYNNLEELELKLTSESEQIQCVVAASKTGIGIPFGSTQQPKLWDYADNVDSVDFLLKI